MKPKLLVLSLFMAVAIVACHKEKQIAPPVVVGVKTAPDGYNKTVTDGTSLFGSWTNTYSAFSFYDINGVLLGAASPGLIHLQVIDSANLKETNSNGLITSDKILLNNNNGIMYLNFISDEGLNTFAIDTLQSNKLTIFQIIKYPTGNTGTINGQNVTVYEVTTKFKYTKVN